MKRNNLVKYLEQNGCVFTREGGNHTLYKNPDNGKVSTVTRHPDIREELCSSISYGIIYHFK
jgi:predicted RNA binding protein YcfA (HicA-like mRNA interferase family)